MRWLLLLLVVVLVAVGSMFLFPEPRAVPTVPVRRNTIQSFVDEQAQTSLPRTYEITAPFAGRIEPTTLRPGDRVTRGQLVAQMVPIDLEEDVTEARAAVQRLSARIAENDDITVEESVRQQAKLFVESMQSAVAAAEARMEAGQSRLDFAETSLGRMRSLQQSGAATREQLDQAELSYVENQVAYRQDVLTVAALKALQSATALLPEIVTEYIDRKELTREVLRQEQAEAEARLRRALQRQERGQLRSPIEGVVLERRIDNEQFVAAGEVILRLGRLEDLEVTADLLSEEIGPVALDHPVQIYGGALGPDPAQGVAGRVVRIHPEGFTKTSSLGVEQQRVTVVVAFADGTLATLLNGNDLGAAYRVRVRILTASRTEALTIPRSALFQNQDGEWSVYAVRNGRATSVPVRVGLRNDFTVEILSGVEENEPVILAPDSDLAEGTRVTASSS